MLGRLLQRRLCIGQRGLGIPLPQPHGSAQRQPRRVLGIGRKHRVGLLERLFGIVAGEQQGAELDARLQVVGG